MSEASIPIVCIVGRKNSGKTELTVSLGAELKRRGYRVMTVKHTHGFQVDHPGKDSWRHRHEGGAVRTVLTGPADFAVVGAWPEGELSLLELVERFLGDADVVLAEGFKAAPVAKIEVFRETTGLDPLFESGEETSSRTMAVVTDRAGFRAPIPVYDFTDPEYISELTDLLERTVFLTGGDP